MAKNKKKKIKKTSSKKKSSPKKVKTLKPEIIEPQTTKKSNSEVSAAEFTQIIDVGKKKTKTKPTATTESKGLVTTDPVSLYMAEVRKYPVLDKEDEIRWAKIYKETGDAKAAEILVTSNLRFVVKVAMEYSKFGARVIDIIQEGNLGLMHAVKEFNPYRGVRLITYAVWWIRGYIQDYLMKQYSMVKIGTTQNQRKLFYQLQKEKDRLDKMGMDSGIAQLSGRLDVPEKDVRQMQQRMSSRDLSLDTPIGDSDQQSLMDFQTRPDDHKIDEDLELIEELAILNEKIDLLEPHLNEKEAFLLKNRVLADEPMTLQEIGNKYGITREAVRQVEARLIIKIREQMKDLISEYSEKK